MLKYGMENDVPLCGNPACTNPVSRNKNGYYQDYCCSRCYRLCGAGMRRLRNRYIQKRKEDWVDSDPFDAEAEVENLISS